MRGPRVQGQLFFQVEQDGQPFFGWVHKSFLMLLRGRRSRDPTLILSWARLRRVDIQCNLRWAITTIIQVYKAYLYHWNCFKFNGKLRCNKRFSDTRCVMWDLSIKLSITYSKLMDSLSLSLSPHTHTQTCTYTALAWHVYMMYNFIINMYILHKSFSYRVWVYLPY